MAERFNRTLLDMLSTTVGNHPASWEQNVRKGMCLAYNSSVHSSTGYSPFILMFWRQVKLPVDLMYGTGEVRSFSSCIRAKIEGGAPRGICTGKRQVRQRTQTAESMRRCMGSSSSVVTLSGYILMLFLKVSPGNVIDRGRDRSKWRSDWGDSTYKIKGLRSIR